MVVRRFHYALAMLTAWALALTALVGCRLQGDGFESILFRDPMDASSRVLAQDAVIFDPQTSADGAGSLRIEADGPQRLHLFEVEGLAVENANLAYRASLRTEGVDGRVSLEMWCSAIGQGEIFARARQSARTGTTEWGAQEVVCFLEEGQRTQAARLDLVIDGPGRVWIDEVRLVRDAS